jgi:hypothetical protein
MSAPLLQASIKSIIAERDPALHAAEWEERRSEAMRGDARS